MALPCHLKWKPLHVPQICCVSRYLLCLSKSSQVICPVFLSSGRWASFSSQIALGSLQELFPLTGMRPDNTSVRLPFSYDSYLVLNIIPHKYPTYQPFVKQHLTTLNSQLDSIFIGLFLGKFSWSQMSLFLHSLPALSPTRMQILRSQVAFMYCSLLYSISRRVFDTVSIRYFLINEWIREFMNISW